MSFTCGDIQPSGCFIYTGAIPAFVTGLTCRPTLDDILGRYGSQVNLLTQKLDMTTLEKRHLDLNPATATPLVVLQTITDNLYELHHKVDTLDEELHALDVGSLTVTVNLGAMAPQAAPCLVNTNTYSLLTILNLLIQEINQIKSQL